MTNRIYPAGLKKSCLASLVGLMLAQSTFALESLSDEYLADTTGEGIALLPENFKMVFQGANDLSTASSYNRGVANPQQYDTGFIRIIPVGENYSKYTNADDLTTKRTKADIFIYGLALSRSDIMPIVVLVIRASHGEAMLILGYFVPGQRRESNSFISRMQVQM